MLHKHHNEFTKAIKKHDHLKHKLLFGTDWHLIEGSLFGYTQFTKSNKYWLDEIDEDLWTRFAIINPMKFLSLTDDNADVSKAENYAAALIAYGADAKEANRGLHLLRQLDLIKMERNLSAP